MKLNEITIEITQQCPNFCVHCSSLSCSKKSSYLSVAKIEEVVDDAVELGCQTVNLSGGEPFLYYGLLQVVNYINQKGLNCHIYTSGICLIDNSPVSIPVSILEKLHGRVDKYIVNVEAADNDTYNRVMGTSFYGFEMMKEFIKNATSLGETVEAHFVPMKYNYRQIPSVIELCSALGISKISFLRLVKQGRCLDNVDDLILNDEELEYTKLLINQCKNHNKMGIRMGIPFYECSNRINCMTGTVKMVIRYDGNVYPCEAFKNDQPKNIVHAAAENVETLRFVDIYHKSLYINEIRNWLESFQQVETCETCFAQYLSTLK